MSHEPAKYYLLTVYGDSNVSSFDDLDSLVEELRRRRAQELQDPVMRSTNLIVRGKRLGITKGPNKRLIDDYGSVHELNEDCNSIDPLGALIDRSELVGSFVQESPSKVAPVKKFSDMFNEAGDSDDSLELDDSAFMA